MAAILVEATAKVILPLALTLDNKGLSKNVLLVPPAAFIKNRLFFFGFLIDS